MNKQAISLSLSLSLSHTPQFIIFSITQCHYLKVIGVFDYRLCFSPNTVKFIVVFGCFWCVCSSSNLGSEGRRESAPADVHENMTV